jgi:small conductance mechanosensitive channel
MCCSCPVPGRTCPLEDLLSLEQRLAGYNALIEHYYQVLLEHGDRLARLGFDPAGPKNFIQENLVIRAERILGRSQLAHEQQVELERRITAGAVDSRISVELEIAETRFDWTTRSLSDIVRILEQVDVPTAEYRQYLIRSTGNLTEDIFDTEVLGGLLDEFAGNALNWVQENGMTAIVRVGLFILIIILFSWLGKLCARLVRRGLRASSLHMSEVLESMVSGIVARIVLAIGVLVAISQLGG